MSKRDFEQAIEALGVQGLEVLKYGYQLNGGVGAVYARMGELTYVMWDAQGRGFSFEINPNVEGCTVVSRPEYLDYRRDADFDPDFIIFNGDDVMLLPTIVQGAQGIISGSAHIMGDTLNKVFDAFEAGKNDVALKNFTKLYKFCRTWADFGRVHPNPILRPAIELKTGLKIGPARGPLAPITKAEMANLKKVMKELELI